MGTRADYRNFWTRTGNTPRARYHRRTPDTVRPGALTVPVEEPVPADRLAAENDTLMDALWMVYGWFQAHPDALEESARLWVVPELRRVLHGEEGER